MTVQAFIEEIQRRYKLGDTLDWTAIRDDLHKEHERAKAPEERVQLLALHKIIMDKVEANVTDPADLEIFRKARDQDYCLLLVRETVSADGNISPALMDNVTRREIAAGRMPPDHNLRKLT